MGGVTTRGADVLNWTFGQPIRLAEGPAGLFGRPDFRPFLRPQQGAGDGLNRPLG